MEKETEQTTLASEYNKMKNKREQWLSAAKEAARYTIPAVMPDDTSLTKSRSKGSLKSPNQSVGADGINNLASKVTLTMMPPNQTFFRFKMDELTLKNAADMSGEETADYIADVNKGLASFKPNEIIWW